MRLRKEDVEETIVLLKRAHDEGGQGDYNEAKVRTSLKANLDNPKILILVDKKITACVILVISPSFYSVKQDLQVIEFYSESAGAAFRLLKEAETWADGWGDSLLHKSFISTGQERVNKMLDRYGYKRMGVIFDMKRMNRGEG